MSLNRRAIMEALFALGQQSTAFTLSSRRCQFWTETVEQPALFLRSTKDVYMPRDPVRNLTKVVMHCEFWIYALTQDKDDVPAILLDDMITSLEQALEPGVMQKTQTLGGLVLHAQIEGDIIKEPGDLNGQAVARVPIQILAVA